MLKHPLMQWNINQMKKLTVPILYILIIYSVIILFNPSTINIFVLIIGLYLITTVGMQLWKKQPIKIKETFFGLIRMLILLSIIILLARYFVIWWGFLGYLLFLAVFTVYILIKRRKQYVGGMRVIEKQIWGKPLDKKNWEDDTNVVDKKGQGVSDLDVIDESYVSSMPEQNNKESQKGSKKRKKHRRNSKPSNATPM